MRTFFVAIFLMAKIWRDEIGKEDQIDPFLGHFFFTI